MEGEGVIGGWVGGGDGDPGRGCRCSGGVEGESNRDLEVCMLESDEGWGGIGV